MASDIAIEEDMGCFKGGFGFTGSTIKRWVATGSPKANEPQTEDIEQPRTPVTTESQQEAPQQTPTAPPRKASSIIDLSGALPCIPNDEAQTPPGSPPASPKLLVDDDKIRIVQEFAVLDDGPIPVIENPVIVSLTINYGDNVDIFRAEISLDKSPDQLKTLVGHLCTHWRQSRPDYMRTLKARNLGVHMKASIKFGDHRDHYVSRDQNGIIRFETVRDFFEDEELDFLAVHPSKLPVIPFLVQVSIISLDDCKPTEPQQEWALHRVARWAIASQSAHSDHLPICHGLYGRYNQNTGVMFPHLIELRERSINGLSIGNAHDPHHHHRIGSPDFYEPQYRGLEMSGLEVHKMIKRNVLFNVKHKRQDPNLPVLPTMTFNEWHCPGLDTDSIPNGPVYLAIRLVNAIPQLKHMYLPNSLLMTVQPGKGTHTAILETLRAALYRYSRSFIGTPARELFEERKNERGEPEPLWGGNRIDVWVLPQKEEGRGVPRLRIFERGSLKRFLDPPEKGRDGSRKLYVEAWLLPKRTDALGGGLESDGDEDD